MFDFNKALRENCVEPVKRNKDGWRWIAHRFPIKGGISIRDTWLHDIGGRENPLLKKLLQKRSSPQ